MSDQQSQAESLEQDFMLMNNKMEMARNILPSTIDLGYQNEINGGSLPKLPQTATNNPLNKSPNFGALLAKKKRLEMPISNKLESPVHNMEFLPSSYTTSPPSKNMVSGHYIKGKLPL